LPLGTHVIATSWNPSTSETLFSSAPPTIECRLNLRGAVCPPLMVFHRVVDVMAESE
jgi:hypothetical protein